MKAMLQGQMVEQMLAKPAPVVVGGADEEDLAHGMNGSGWDGGWQRRGATAYSFIS